MSAPQTRYPSRGAASRSPCSRPRRVRARGRRPRRCPRARARTRAAVELPPQLADVRHPKRQARHASDGDLTRTHVRERLIREIGGRQRLQDGACLRPPDAETGVSRGLVRDLHRAVVGEVLGDPREIVLAECGSGHDSEAVLRETRDREVALDAAERIQHLRVRHLPDIASDAVGAEPLEQSSRAMAGDEDLRERALVEDRRPSRHARCSAPTAGDQSFPAQPRGRSASSPLGAFDSNQFARSQPDFSPNTAPSSRSR